MAEDDDSDVILGDDAMAHGSLRTQVAVLNAKVKLVGYLLRHDYVTRYEFAPVKLIAFGIVAIVISAVLAAVLAVIVHKP